ncbi:MAG: cytochrome c3 family protein [Planctomycetota bacterium]
MNATQTHVIRGALLLLLAVLAASGGGRAQSEDSPSGGYVGALACRECHPELHGAWAGSSHARTLREPTKESLPPEVLEGRRVAHRPGQSRFFAKDDRYFVETVGDSGEPEVFPLTHVVGVRRILMFLTRLPNGRLQVLPAMRDEGREEWFDYTHLIFGVPGADPAKPPVVRPGEPTFWTGMPRFFDARCARCHTSGWRSVDPGPDGVGPRSAWRATGIDCETCHGPGERHAAYWSDEPPADLEDDPMLVVGELARERAVALCLRCHMEAEVVDPDFRPGDDLFAHFDPTLLDDRERVDAAGRPLELIYDGLPFLASECAREGGLTCVSCHSPHGTDRRAQLSAPPGGGALCAACHEDVVEGVAEHSFHEPFGSGGACVSCHMPFLTIERGHGAVTDHTIGIPRPSSAGERAATDACTWCHTAGRGAPAGAPGLSPRQIREAFASWWPDAKPRPSWGPVIAAGRRRDAGAKHALLSLVGDLAVPRVARASAARLLGELPGVVAKDLSPLASHPDTLVRRNAVAGLAGHHGELADGLLLRALVDDSPAVRGRAARAALLGWERVRENRSLREAVLAVLEEEAAAVPDDDRRWFRLGAARQIAGDLAGAIRAYERKLRLDPYASRVRQTVEKLRARLRAREE